MTSVHNSSGLAPPRQMTSDHNSSELGTHNRCTTLPSHSGFSQKKLVSFVTEIHTTSIDFLIPTVNKSPTHYPCDSARTFRVILFSIHNDEWKSFQCHHQTALRSYALSWKPCQGDSLNLPDHRIHKDGDGDASFQLDSDSLPHAHAQTTKTYYKHQDSRIMKAQELKTKTSAQTLIYKIFLQRYQVYQGRLLASFQDDAKYEHVGQDTRSQGSKERLASPKPRKPGTCLRWSPTGRMFDIKGKIIESSESESQSDCSKGDNKFLGTVCFGNDHIAVILGYGDLKWGNILITRVYFVEGLGHNLFLVGQFCDLDLEVAFRRNTCYVRNLEAVDLLKGNRTTNLYTINLHEMASASPICLMARATSTKKSDISFLNVFGVLYYPKNDHEDIGKLGEKGDIGFFIGYSANSCAYRVYNRRTKKIMKTMNVTFDELSTMPFEQRSLKPGLQGMTSRQISSGLDLTYAPSTITTQKPTKRELDLLFEAMYDDYIGGRPLSATRTALAAQAPQVLHTLTASTTT
ncbi:hypothetical protein Tco_1171991 [Tanacetum coccineum]